MNTLRFASLAASIALLGGCSSSSSSSSAGNGPVDSGASPDGSGSDAVPDAGEAGPAEAGTSTNVRGQRYCEIVAATLSGSTVDAAVYSTWGLNDCPETQWAAENTTALAQQLAVTEVVLNGPRYWMMDTLSGTFINTTQVMLGGIAMREAGAITGNLSATPYTTHQIQRNTVVTFDAGSPVFELVDPQGYIYDMQSYSTQKVTTQTQSTLPSLGSMLTLPSGWSWRTRTLTSDLTLTTPGGMATVVQDDYDNTYQQSQQTPEPPDAQ